MEPALVLSPGDEKEVSQAARTDALRADPCRDREEDRHRKTVAEETNRAQQRGGADGDENRAVQHATQFSVLDRPLSGG